MWSGTIQIEQFDPKSDPERLRACHAIAMSAWDIDNPGVPPLTFEMVGPGQGYNDVLFTRDAGHVRHADQLHAAVGPSPI